jgi:hypothetical protein
LIFQVLSFGSKTIQEDIVTEIAATMAFSATQNNDRIDFIFRPNRIIHSTKKDGRTLRIIRELIEFQPQKL